MRARLIIAFDHTLAEPLSVTQPEPESKGTLWFSATFWGEGVCVGGLLRVKCLHRLFTDKF